MRTLLKSIGLLAIVAAAIIGILLALDIASLAESRELLMRSVSVLAIIGIAGLLISLFLKKS